MGSCVYRKLWILFAVEVLGTYSLLSSPCGDWIPYGEDECIKIVTRTGTQTQEAAKITCQSYVESGDPEDVPRLVTIKTNEKQTFVEGLVFEKHATYDSIWLGLEMRNDSMYRWNDGSDVSYSNWATQQVNESDFRCVQMESEEFVNKTGRWVRVNCKKNNAVICERSQLWSLTRLKKSLLTLKMEHEKDRNESENQLAAIKEETKRKLAVAKQEAEEKVIAAKQEAEKKIMEAEKKINAVKQEAEGRLNAAKQEAEKRLKDAEGKITSLKQETEKKILVARQEAENLILDTERKIALNKQEEERKINETEIKIKAIKDETSKKITEFQRVTDQKIGAVKQEASTKIENFIKNPVPIGFVYTQLPGQDPPTKFWPQTKWSDISATYAGLFFRVTGGNAAPFGQIQEDTCPRLSNVEWKHIGNGGGVSKPAITVPANGGWSEYVYTGDMDGSTDIFLRFHLSGGEVRPRNKAVVVWKRTA